MNGTISDWPADTVTGWGKWNETWAPVSLDSAACWPIAILGLSYKPFRAGAGAGIISGMEADADARAALTTTSARPAWAAPSSIRGWMRPNTWTGISGRW